MSDKASNVTWHEQTVSREERERLGGHRGCTIWFTGLSGSGKSTLANALDAHLTLLGYRSYVLYGDNVRHGLNKDLGFSPEDRTENIRRIGEVAALFTHAGIINATAFISPYRADRDASRAMQEEGDFIEVHVHAPLDVCEERDPKGLYKKARAGIIKQFTGIDAPYEAPEAPEIVVHTGEQDVQACLQQIVSYLQGRGIIGK